MTRPRARALHLGDMAVQAAGRRRLLRMGQLVQGAPRELQQDGQFVVRSRQVEGGPYRGWYGGPSTGCVRAATS